MKFKPAPQYVLVEPTPAATMSSGGIILIKGIETSKTGTVRAVGKDSVVKEGDQVVFELKAGEPYEESGQTYLVVPEDNLIGVL